MASRKRLPTRYSDCMALELPSFCMAKGTDDPTTRDDTHGIPMVARNSPTNERWRRVTSDHQPDQEPSSGRLRLWGGLLEEIGAGLLRGPGEVTCTGVICGVGTVERA